MSILKKIYYTATPALPGRLFRSGGPMGLLLPYHHVVSNEFLPHINQLYAFKNVQQFTEDLDFLLKHYKPLHPDDLAKAIYNHAAIPPGSFLLTFDDGFREVYDNIAPILEKKGVPAIFFINPAFVDNRELFYRCKISLLIDELKNKTADLLPDYSKVLAAAPATDTVIATLKNLNQNNAAVLDVLANNIHFSFQDFLEKQKPFLTSSQVVDLHKRGFTIGAHSMNHPYYHLLSVEEQVRQTIDSCNYVKELLRTEECHFSFPHSDAGISQSVINAINQQQTGLLFGIQNQKKELQNRILHRFNAERPETSVNALIKGQLLLNKIQQLTGRDTVKRN
jgi:peptidoglycan/xylan/chitin deacetylase (PgdA/CDA1 family)